MRYRGYYIGFKPVGRSGYWVARKYVKGTNNSTIVCSGSTSWDCMVEVDKIISQEENERRQKFMSIWGHEFMYNLFGSYNDWYDHYVEELHEEPSNEFKSEAQTYFKNLAANVEQ